MAAGVLLFVLVMHATTASILPGPASQISGPARVNAVDVSIWILYSLDVNAGDEAQ